MSSFLTSLEDIQVAANDLRDSMMGQRIPNNARPVSKFGQVVAPDYTLANQVELLKYTVPANWTAEFYGVVLGFISNAGGPSPLPGDIIFTADINRPLGSTLGYTEKDYGNIPFPLGDLTGGPYWPIRWRHVATETLRLKGYTVANVPTGDGSFLVAALVGYEWPTQTKD